MIIISRTDVAILSDYNVTANEVADLSIIYNIMHQSNDFRDDQYFVDIEESKDLRTEQWPLI